MKTDKYLVDCQALKSIISPISDIMTTYGLTTPKSLLGKFTIKTKILPILNQRGDKKLAISTLYWMIDSAKLVLTEKQGVYVPILGEAELNDVVDYMIQYIPIETAPEILRDFISLIDSIKVTSSRDKVLSEFIFSWTSIMSDIKKKLEESLGAAIGYAMAIRNEGDTLPIVNAYLHNHPSFHHLDVDKDEDLRQLVFSEIRNEDGLILIDEIGKSVGCAISDITTKSKNNDILEGASVVKKDIVEESLVYLSEVRCSVSNVKETVELCERTNYDLECDSYGNTVTSEDCVPDITTAQFGWSDSSIVCKNTDEIMRNVGDIFSTTHITGKNMQYILGAIAVEDDDTTRDDWVDNLTTAACNTLKWELVHDDYADLPIVHFMNRTEQIMNSLTKNTHYNPRVMTAISAVKEAMSTVLKEEVGTTFNPCPSPLNMTPFPVGARNVQLMFNNIYSANTDEEMDNAMLEFAKLYNVGEVLTESNAISKGARSVSRKVQKNTASAIRNVGSTAHEVKQAAKNAVNPMEKYIGQMMEKIKKADAAQRREVIIRGGVVPKVLRWIKRSIPLIAGAGIGAAIPPAAIISGIALLGFIASDKYLDSKEKRKILREIEDEIELTNEKIDDSRGDNNKQKKYELMRIRNNLKRTQNRILYNLKE